MAGIYIHVPFCASKCLYCAFYSSPGSKVNPDEFASSIIDEFSARTNELTENVTTVYFGGGTPSLLPSDAIGKIINGLAERTGEKWNPTEITLEANPDDITRETVELWQHYGINRVSIGIQSFSDEELKSCGRRHSSEDGVQAINIIKEYFNNVSTDLICGLPSQTYDSWKFSVEKMISLKPDHISAYILETDSDSRLAHLIETGKIKIPDEEEINRRFIYLCKRLSESGYDRYEISNFALKGKKSLHNSSYWAGTPYIGLGPAAASYNGGSIRRINLPDTTAYMTTPSDPPHTVECLSEDDIVIEYLLTRLRTRKGIDLKDFSNRFSKARAKKLINDAKRFIASGQLKLSDTGSGLSLTEEGTLVSDYILSSLV